MTDEDLELLYNAATAGPWSTRQTIGFEGDIEIFQDSSDSLGILAIVPHMANNGSANAEAIVALHNALPELLGELRALREWKRRASLPRK